MAATGCSENSVDEALHPRLQAASSRHNRELLPAMCLGILQVVQVTLRMVRLLVNNELQRMWKEAVVASFGVCPGICLRNTRKPIADMFKYSVSLSPGSNRTCPEHESFGDVTSSVYGGDAEPAPHIFIGGKAGL
jgi:hypothetical protein